MSRPRKKWTLHSGNSLLESLLHFFKIAFILFFFFFFSSISQWGWGRKPVSEWWLTWEVSCLKKFGAGAGGRGLKEGECGQGDHILLRLKKKSLLGFFSELISLSEWKEPRSDRRRQAQGKGAQEIFWSRAKICGMCCRSSCYAMR